MNVKFNCVVCNIIAYKSKYSNRKTCSEACRRQLLSNLWKQPPKYNTCLFCGSQTTNPKFCNSSCSASYNNSKRKPRTTKSKERTSNAVKKFIKNNPNRTKKKYTVNKRKKRKKFYTVTFINCKSCGVLFCSQTTTKTKKPKRLTCSDECYLDQRTKNGIRSNRSKIYCHHTNSYVWVDSNWEIAVAKYLNSLNINWLRPKYIPWVDSFGKNRKYFPDFYLPDYNLYLDPKNPYRMKIDKEKLSIISSKVNLLVGDLNYILERLGGLEPKPASRFASE